MAIKLNPFSTDQLSTLLMGETAGKEKIIGAKDTEYTDRDWETIHLCA